MKTFTDYLVEGKNTHMTHVEDLVFEGSESALEAISFLEQI